MAIGRRDFLKIAAGGGLLMTAAPGAAIAAPRKTAPPGALGILYDSAICIGCKVCVLACKQANPFEGKVTHESALGEDLWEAPSDLSAKTLNIIKIYKHGTGEVKDRAIDGHAFIKRHCMHCVDPACVSACPVSALQKNPENGVVRYNKGACIGCRYCQIACPYGIPQFQWDEPFPQIRKCQLCDHRYAEGHYSACCEECPTGASIFGPVEDLLKEAKRRLALPAGQYHPYPVNKVDSDSVLHHAVPVYQNHVYGEKEAGGSQYMMLSAVPFEALGMPVLSDTSPAAVSEGIQQTLYKNMIAPAVVFAGLLFAAYNSSKKE